MFVIIAGAVALAVAYSALSKHLQIACYSGPVIVSKPEAVMAAKNLVVKVKDRFFDFPGLGTSQDFVASLDEHPKCCGATKYFSFTYLASVWDVTFASQRHFAFIVMDECGQKMLDRGRLAN